MKELRMLSDKFIENAEYSEDHDLYQQINRLEELSISMSELINNGHSQKIMHLEKVRQKILTDIIKQKKIVSEDMQPKITNIIDLNKKMIEKMHDKRRNSLGFIKKKIDCYESYRKF